MLYIIVIYISTTRVRKARRCCGPPLLANFFTPSRRAKATQDSFAQWVKGMGPGNTAPADCPIGAHHGFHCQWDLCEGGQWEKLDGSTIGLHTLTPSHTSTPWQRDLGRDETETETLPDGCYVWCKAWLVKTRQSAQNKQTGGWWPPIKTHCNQKEALQPLPKSPNLQKHSSARIHPSLPGIPCLPSEHHSPLEVGWLSQPPTILSVASFKPSLPYGFRFENLIKEAQQITPAVYPCEFKIRELILALFALSVLICHLV